QTNQNHAAIFRNKNHAGCNRPILATSTVLHLRSLILKIYSKALLSKFDYWRALILNALYTNFGS
ncbi:MAG: hypothetical protein M3243_02830, partial [Thermoproteota archaeon]|nr:hypothetical protein [Thermoproteota archaeon]